MENASFLHADAHLSETISARFICISTKNLAVKTTFAILYKLRKPRYRNCGERKESETTSCGKDAEKYSRTLREFLRKIIIELTIAENEILRQESSETSSRTEKQSAQWPFFVEIDSTHTNHIST